MFQKEKFDLVYHLAAEFGRMNGEHFFETLWKSNVIGTKNIIQMQIKHKFRLVFSSSSEIYGDYKDYLRIYVEIYLRYCKLSHEVFIVGGII